MMYPCSFQNQNRSGFCSSSVGFASVNTLPFPLWHLSLRKNPENCARHQHFYMSFRACADRPARLSPPFYRSAVFVLRDGFIRKSTFPNSIIIPCVFLSFNPVHKKEAGNARRHSTRDSTPKKAIISASRTSSCFHLRCRSPAHSRIKAFGQNHHLVLPPMPSARSPACWAHTPLRNT